MNIKTQNVLKTVVLFLLAGALLWVTVTVPGDATAQPASETQADTAKVREVALTSRGGSRQPLRVSPDAELPFTTVTTTVVETIPFNTKKVNDPDREVGTETVTQKGVAGEKRHIYVSGPAQEPDSGQLLVTVNSQEPVTEVIAVGTKKKPPVVKTPSVPNVSDNPSGNRALGKEMVLAQGWDINQYKCLDALWTRESNWRTTAKNPSSGAYGIPQAYPGTKLATAGADWQTNPRTQIKWGLGYIKNRYGTPCAAWGHSQQKGWY